MKSTKPSVVLIVEDEVFIALSLEQELKNAGFSVCKRVATGEAAINAAAEYHPDIILMDIRLSGNSDGIEAAEKIRMASDASIIFMTGYQDDELDKRVKKLNPIGVFVKPIDIKSIIRLLRDG